MLLGIPRVNLSCIGPKGIFFTRPKVLLLFKFFRFVKPKAHPSKLHPRHEGPQPTGRMPVRLACSGNEDFVLLVSGSGIGDTGGGLCLCDGSSVQTIDRVSAAGLAVREGRLARILSTPISTGTGEILIYDGRGITHYLSVDELSDAAGNPFAQRYLRQRRSLGSGSGDGLGAGADLLSRLPASFLATRSRRLPEGSNFSFASLYFVSQPLSSSLLA
jgi:hypothetical protein